MDSWENFKKKQQSEEKPQGRKIMGTYRCQFCDKFVFKATYYPVDKVLKWVCEDDHASFIENFKLAI